MTDQTGQPATGRPVTPFRLDLDQQKKRAKELLRGLRAEEPEAVARFRAHHPQDRPGGPAAACLADAQFVIARELGSQSWPKLRAHIEAMGRARIAIDTAIGTGAAPPDGEMTTLHVRCGSDLRPTLRDAGFVGDFLEHSDPYGVGPVPDGPGLLAVRARFLADSYGAAMGMTEAAMVTRLHEQAEGLAQAAARYRRVVLWCEHDSYDQLALARCLAQFDETGAPPVLELVSTDRFPGAARFIGLGQLPPEAIRMLWPARRPLGAAERAMGRLVWDALRRDDPRDLAAIADAAPGGLPDLPRAVRRHLQELPWTGDGLSLTERLALRIVEAEPLPFGRVFALLMRQWEPLPWLGDIMFQAILRVMAQAPVPACTLHPAGPEEPWWKGPVAITDAGRAILRGERDWLALGPPERWVGGVRIRPGEPHWRWDEAAGRPVRG